MTVDEARALLAPLADGLLEPEMAREVEAIMQKAPELQQEFRVIKEENAMLTEALAPLKPSQSTRVRVSDAMQEAYKRAEEADKLLAEQKKRIARLLVLVVVVLLVGIGIAAVLYKTRPASRPKKPPTPAVAPPAPPPAVPEAAPQPKGDLE
jgi:anti-sigma factor RsiW